MNTPRSRFLRRQLATASSGSPEPAGVEPVGECSGPTPRQADEIWRTARLGAQSAGARGPDLDDVAQIVAERLTVKWNEGHVLRARSRGPEAWQAYVRVAARNAFRDLRRREGRLKARELRVADQTSDTARRPTRPGTVRPLVPIPSGLDELEARLYLLELIDKELTARQREVLTLRLLDGLTTREIAGRLDLSIRTVNQAKQDGIERLRQLLLPQAPAAGNEL